MGSTMDNSEDIDQEAATRFWGNYINLLVEQKVKEKVRRWYVKRVEQYIRHYHGQRLRIHTASSPDAVQRNPEWCVVSRITLRCIRATFYFSPHPQNRSSIPSSKSSVDKFTPAFSIRSSSLSIFLSKSPMVMVLSSSS